MSEHRALHTHLCLPLLASPAPIALPRRCTPPAGRLRVLEQQAVFVLPAFLFPFLQQTMSQSRKLAEQVAQMRALARAGGGSLGNPDPMRAAEEAAARLNRKFGVTAPGPAGGRDQSVGASLAAAAAKAVEAASGMDRKRSRSPPRCVRAG